MDARHKRLLFRARHMGTNENDILFGTFAEKHLADMTPEQLDRFEALLEENDPDLFLWITGAKPTPERLQHDVFKMIQNFNLVAARP